MRRAVILGALILLAGALFVVPLPLYVVSPGGALVVEDRVELAHAEQEVSGDLLLTTVRLQRATPAAALMGWVDDTRTVLPRTDVVPEGVDDQRYFRVQRELFAESARLAAAVGLQAAGFDVTFSGDGAEVVAVLPDAPAATKLSEGDVVVAVGGAPVEVAGDLVAATMRRAAGDVVVLAVERDGQRREVRIELERVGRLERPGLGVVVHTRNAEIRLPFDVNVDQGRIGGPSAGLMIALAVYDLAGEEDLTDGRVIAGTGTIDRSARVGPVGGVTQKVAAAVAAGAEIFLVPPAEAATARRAGGNELDVVAVETLDEAIAALEEAQ